MFVLQLTRQLAWRLGQDGQAAAAELVQIGGDHGPEQGSKDPDAAGSGGGAAPAAPRARRSSHIHRRAEHSSPLDLTVVLPWPILQQNAANVHVVVRILWI